uniref:Uncharacterized protein n=1 Tax=Nelumbo nucifera TaxID=4432 RepID=A0A822Z3X3_NELNU|nr:TPA_asm: hypothetical protein HUJ06_008780 [Nelumbo nucifera]
MAPGRSDLVKLGKEAFDMLDYVGGGGRKRMVAQPAAAASAAVGGGSSLAVPAAQSPDEIIDCRLSAKEYGRVQIMDFGPRNGPHGRKAY